MRRTSAVTTYDTAAGAGFAANKAILDGNRLILGPLLAEEVVAVASVARPAEVPMITYSNDSTVADRDVFVLGQVPGQAISRVIGFAQSKGVKVVGAIIPAGAYGQRVSSALTVSARALGVSITGDRGLMTAPALRSPAPCAAFSQKARSMRC